jgi:Flp pilus assembly protein TadG
MQRLQHVLREVTGAEIAELAAVLPVLFTVLLAVFFFGRAYNLYGTLNQAALQGARAAVAPTCATCGNTPMPANQVATNYVAPVLKASGLDPAWVTYVAPTSCQCGSVGCSATVSCDPTGTGATPSICVQRNIALNSTAGSPQVCGALVTFQYTYTFNLPFTPFSIPIKATAQMRQEDQQ